MQPIASPVSFNTIAHVVSLWKNVRKTWNGKLGKIEIAGTEKQKRMLDYCINEKHFENIWADHFTGNPASGRVMEKCGFVDTGMLNKCSQLVGGDKEMVKVFKYKG